MRQVPTDNSIALIGSGSLATHLHHYFHQLDIEFLSWSRNGDPTFNTFNDTNTRQRLKKVVEQSHKIILLVSDIALSSLIDEISRLTDINDKLIIHCSGVTTDGRAKCMHPLMTFSGDGYSIELYRSIPFITDTGTSLRSLMPELPNPSYAISPEHRAFYHSLCVISGNFAQILWKACCDQMQSELGLPDDVMNVYLKQNTENYLRDNGRALTGPLVRGDRHTIDQHLNALSGHPLEAIYLAFLDIYEKKTMRKSA